MGSENSDRNTARSLEYYRGGFNVLYHIKDRDIRALISSQIGQISLIMSSYIGGMVFISFLLCFKLASSESVETFLFQLCAGFVIGIVLIPLHEMIHGLYFKSIGSEEIRFILDFRRLRFGCYSHQFIMSKWEYIRLLLAPFVVFSFVLLLCAFTFADWATFFLSMLLMHSSYCAGDFALVSFTQKIDEKALYVYYDQKLEKTFFVTDK